MCSCACPPDIKPEKLCFFFISCIPLLKTFNATGAINELLLARIKRVAFVADFYVCALDGCICFDNITTGTGK